jgi:hypothetical protein
MKTVIIATLTAQQLEYLKGLASQHNISFEIIVEGPQVAVEPAPATPITAEMLAAVASNTGKTVLEVAAIANQHNIGTVEDALQNSDIPSSVKEILESYL